MTILKPVDYSLMEIGEKLGPVKLKIDDHFLKWYSFCVDDNSKLKLSDDGKNYYNVAPASSLVCDLLRLLYTKYDPNQDLGLHQWEEVEFFSPLIEGEEVELTGKFIDKYVKRGKVYFVTEASAHSMTDGRLIVKHIATETADINPSYKIGGRTAKEGEKRWVKTEFPTDKKPIISLNKFTEVGTPLIGPIKKVYQDQISLFSNAQAFWRSIHTDLEVATKAGLETTVAQGLMETCYISEWATELFGVEWNRSGKISMTFLSPVYPNDILSIKGVLTSNTKKNDGHWIEIDFWIENQNGVKAAVGWLNILLP